MRRKKILVAALLVLSTVSSLGQKVTLSYRNRPLKAVFTAVTRQTGYSFMYSSQIVNADTRISISAQKEELTAVLNRMFSRTDISYVIRGKEIVLFRKETKSTTPAIKRTSNQQPESKNSRSVSGIVKDVNGEGIVGANIVVVGATPGYGATTDASGRFTLLNVSDRDLLKISYVGYQTQTVRVGENSNLNVVLQEKGNGLDELVVVGYGVQRKVDLTGAVDQISSKEIGALEVNTMAEALEGQIPNLNVDVADGKPGRAASFNIRGTTSINGGSPLIVIDGVAATSYDINNLSPKDIGKISVLKDAASAAIYGARGTYGVILITTKKAKPGQFQVSYSNNFGWSRATRIMDLYNKPDYASIINDFASNIGQAFFTSSQVDYFEKSWKDSSLPAATYQKGGTLFGNKQHNFYKEWLREYTPRQNHHLSVMGGTKKFQYFLSGDFNHEEGNIKFKPDQINRYNLRSNITYHINKHVSIFNYTDILSRKDDTAYTNLYSWISNIYRFIENTNPYYPERMDVNGKTMMTDAGWYKNFVQNRSGNVRKVNRFTTTLGFDVSVLDNSLRIHGDYTYKHDDTNDLMWAYLNDPLLYLYSNNSTISDIYPSGSSKVSRTMGDLITTIYNLYATYDKNFGIHHGTLMVGINREDNATFSETGTRANPLDVKEHSLNLADGTAVITETDSKNASQSAFFRLNYNYGQRYLLEINGCYNVSSKFPAGKRDAMFFSVSGGWNIAQEKFFQPLTSVINEMKLRASYGSLGNQNVGSYDYMSMLGLSQTGYTLEGERGNRTSAPSPKSTHFTWEQAQTIDVGLDLSFLNNRLMISGDFYQRDTKKMLAKMHSLPSVFGATIPKENNARLRTRGWEIALGWNDSFELAGSNFRYGIRAGISDYTSKIMDYYNPTNYLGDYYVGEHIGEIWGLTNDGYFQTDEEAKNGALLETSWNKSYQRAGTIRFKDIDKDGKISKGSWTLADHGDFKIIGNTTPRYLYSFTLNASYRGFDVNAFFRGVGKRDIYPDGASVSFWGPYARKYQLMPKFVGENIWTKDNPNAYFPRPQAYIAGDAGLDLSFPQTKYLQNAAYLRLKNLTIGYTLPTKLTNKVLLSKVRIYFTGQNLFEFTKLNKALDPEGLTHDPDASSSIGMGTAYPVQRTYSFGIEVQF